MIRELIRGMAAAISAEFGEDCTIYTEDIEQGLKTPCFYISCVDAQQNRHRGDVYFSEHRFMVLYFPGSDKPKEECLETADRLWTALEIISTPEGKKMGTGMQADIKDGLLNFSLTYSSYLRRTGEETEYMEHLTGTYKGV